MTARDTPADSEGALPLRIRVVVVTWNGLHLLPSCLDSLLAQDLPAGTLDIVVVDNASTDHTAEMLARDYPTVEVRTTARNLGFAGGVDVGLAGLQHEFAVLLNNDATFASDAVRKLVEHLMHPANSRVGAATARILLMDPDPTGHELVNSTGNVLTRSGAAADRDWLALADGPAAAADVFGFCGGAAALRGAALDEVGSFDPSLFLYYEDTDLSWRMRARGWDVHYVHDAVAHHRHAASSDATSALFRYYNTRNSLIVFTRHAPWGAVTHGIARQLTAAVWHTLRRDEPVSVTTARRRALKDYALRLGRTLSERSTLWRDASRDRTAVYSAGLSSANGRSRG